MTTNLISPLNIPRYYHYDALKVINGLYTIPRTGFKDRGVKNCETVGEHTDAVILMAKELFPEIINLQRMLKIHDWPEFLTGDLRTDSYATKEQKVSKKEKYDLELQAMKVICNRLGYYGREILALWLEFESQETRRAKIAKEIDKVQSILKASYYEAQGEQVLARHFYEEYKNQIKEPKLIKKLEIIGFK